MIEFKWQKIDDQHERAKVIGGWVLKTYEDVTHMYDGINQSGYDVRVAMVFIPDPNYEWDLVHLITDK